MYTTYENETINQQLIKLLTDNPNADIVSVSLVDTDAGNRLANVTEVLFFSKGDPIYFGSMSAFEVYDRGYARLNTDTYADIPDDNGYIGRCWMAGSDMILIVTTEEVN